MLRPTHQQTNPTVIMAISIAKSTAWVVREDDGGSLVASMTTTAKGMRLPPRNWTRRPVGGLRPAGWNALAAPRPDANPSNAVTSAVPFIADCVQPRRYRLISVSIRPRTVSLADPDQDAGRELGSLA
jgi:hypothetical protein